MPIFLSPWKSTGRILPILGLLLQRLRQDRGQEGFSGPQLGGCLRGGPHVPRPSGGGPSFFLVYGRTICYGYTGEPEGKKLFGGENMSIYICIDMYNLIKQNKAESPSHKQARNNERCHLPNQEKINTRKPQAILEVQISKKSPPGEFGRVHGQRQELRGPNTFSPGRCATASRRSDPKFNEPLKWSRSKMGRASVTEIDWWFPSPWVWLLGSGK